MAESPVIDLRSDTVTRPTPGMREAMSRAEVGDDQFGEDPTVNRLQERIAAMLGKEAALWTPTGTMSNQVALLALTRPGDDVVASRDAHIVLYETGAAAANAGVQITQIGDEGRFTAEEFLAARKPRGHIASPPTTLAAVENTHNRAGGRVFPQAEAEAVCAAARAEGAATFLDGARLWNAAAATGLPPADLAAPFDLVAVSFSKGLGAPAGSALAGPRSVIQEAIRHRRRLGGAMRQAGILAAAALYALDHHLERLAEDHHNARLLAETLSLSSRVRLDPRAVETNIIIFDLADGAPDAAAVAAGAEEAGVLLMPVGPRTLRAVTHLDVTAVQCRRAADVLLSILEN